MNETHIAEEYNFDGLIGPTHNFSGLAFGNLAATQNRFLVSNPKAAALQGLAKMKLLHNLGLKQGFIPPQERPSLKALREFGYEGRDRYMLEKASKANFEHVLISWSASAMWVANAATVSPSFDTHNQLSHLTPANLVSQKHRRIEAEQTSQFLKNIFK